MTLATAVLAALFELRDRTKTPWKTVRTLHKHLYRDTGMSLHAVEDVALMCGSFLDTREGWQEFAAMVAEKLPSQDDVGEVA